MERRSHLLNLPLIHLESFVNSHFNLVVNLVVSVSTMIREFVAQAVSPPADVDHDHAIRLT